MFVRGTKGRPLQDVSLWHTDYSELETIKAQKTWEDTLTPPLRTQAHIYTQLHKKNFYGGTALGGSL